jgi:hypothetical protein
MVELRIALMSAEVLLLHLVQVIMDAAKQHYSIYRVAAVEVVVAHVPVQHPVVLTPLRKIVISHAIWEH